MKLFTEIMGWVVAIFGAFIALAITAASVGFVLGFCFAVARATFRFWN